MAGRALMFFIPLLIAIGCGSGSTGPRYQPGEVSCEDICDRQGAPGCSRTPPDYVASCKTLCAAARDGFPQCTAQLDAIHACAANRVTYRCDADGNLETVPTGACPNEGLACLNCTGDLLACL